MFLTFNFEIMVLKPKTLNFSKFDFVSEHPTDGCLRYSSIKRYKNLVQTGQVLLKNGTVLLQHDNLI